MHDVMERGCMAKIREYTQSHTCSINRVTLLFCCSAQFKVGRKGGASCVRRGSTTVDLYSSWRGKEKQRGGGGGSGFIFYSVLFCYLVEKAAEASVVARPFLLLLLLHFTSLCVLVVKYFHLQMTPIRRGPLRLNKYTKKRKKKTTNNTEITTLS